MPFNLQNPEMPSQEMNYSHEGGESTFDNLEERLAQIPPIDPERPVTLDRVVGSAISKGHRNFARDMESRGWGTREDISQEAYEGVYKAWLDIESADGKYITYYNTILQDITADPERYKELLDESVKIGRMFPDMVGDIALLAYLKKGAIRNMNRYMRENAGSPRSYERSVVNTELNFSDITGYDDDEIEEDRLSAESLTSSAETVPELLSSLGYHNAPNEVVISTVCRLLDMGKMNFTDEDVPAIQELFVNSLLEALDSDRYRPVSEITKMLEKDVVERVFVERVASLKSAYLGDVLTEKPFDWEYSPNEKEDVPAYDAYKDSIIQTIREYQKDHPDETPILNEDGTYNLTGWSQISSNVYDKHPYLSKGYERRKSALRRIRKRLQDRGDEVVDTFEGNIIDYLMEEKNQERVY